jgi:hypothetical protein
VIEKERERGRPFRVDYYIESYIYWYIFNVNRIIQSLETHYIRTIRILSRFIIIITAVLLLKGGFFSLSYCAKILYRVVNSAASRTLSLSLSHTHSFSLY